MLAVVTIVAALLAIWSLVGVGWLYRSWLRLPIRRRAYVTLTDGTTVAGVLWRRHGGYVTLRDARLHAEGQQVPIDGEVVIDRDRIQFLQLLEGGR